MLQQIFHEPIIFVFIAAALCCAAPLALAAYYLKSNGFPLNNLFKEPKRRLLGLKIAPGAGISDLEALEIFYSLQMKRSGEAKQGAAKLGEANKLKLLKVEFFKEINGRGAAGIVNRRAVVCGSSTFMKECGVECPMGLERQAAGEKAQGRGIEYMAWEGQVRALILLEEGEPAIEHAWQLKRLSLRLARVGIITILLSICMLAFSGCERAPAVISTLRGSIIASSEDIKAKALERNAVCYLIVKDKWGVPVIIKRWLNPTLPLSFHLKESDLLLPSRSWKGPFMLEAYLFISDNNRQELPPPSNAAKAATKELVALNSTPVVLSLRR